ncbi:MAG: hypothetical protein ACK5MP_10765 [Nostocoides sp.]
MGPLAILAVALGTVDVVRGPLTGADRPTRRSRTMWSVGIGLGIVALLGGTAGFVDPWAVLPLLTGAACLVLWVFLTDRAAGPHDDADVSARRAARWAIVALLAPIGVTLALPGGAETVGPGPLETWLTGIPLSLPMGGGPTQTLMVVGMVLIQLATANIVVRFTLAAVGAVKPAGHPQPSDRLRGGRLIGPMERIIILGLGLAGNLTAASLVIAAKGLIRFPELQAHGADADRPGIDEVTEYFLVGSLVSWLVSLVALTLVVGSG